MYTNNFRDRIGNRAKTIYIYTHTGTYIYINENNNTATAVNLLYCNITLYEKMKNVSFQTHRYYIPYIGTINLFIKCLI